MSLKSNQLFRQISKARKQERQQNRLATVVSVVGEAIYLQFYGETEMSQKSYKRLASYTPTVGDVVVASYINGSYIITGKVV